MMDPSRRAPGVQACRGNFIIFSCFGWSSVGSTVSCGSADYLNILNDWVFPWWMFFFPDSTFMFQDSNARVYQAQTMNKWFKEHETSFSHVSWPTQT